MAERSPEAAQNSAGCSRRQSPRGHRPFLCLRGAQAMPVTSPPGPYLPSRRRAGCRSAVVGMAGRVAGHGRLHSFERGHPAVRVVAEGHRLLQRHPDCRVRVLHSRSPRLAPRLGCGLRPDRAQARAAARHGARPGRVPDLRDCHQRGRADRGPALHRHRCRRRGLGRYGCRDHGAGPERKRIATLSASCTPVFGAGLGPFLAGVLSETLPAPTVTVFVVEAALLVTAVLAVLRMPFRRPAMPVRGAWVRVPAVPREDGRQLIQGVAVFAVFP